MVKITITVNGREVSLEEAKRMAFDTALANRLEQVKAAVGNLPVELVFEGDLRVLKLRVKNCPDDLVAELERRLQPFV